MVIFNCRSCQITLLGIPLDLQSVKLILLWNVYFLICKYNEMWKHLLSLKYVFASFNSIKSWQCFHCYFSGLHYWCSKIWIKSCIFIRIFYITHMFSLTNLTVTIFLVWGVSLVTFLFGSVPVGEEAEQITSCSNRDGQHF